MAGFKIMDREELKRWTDEKRDFVLVDTLGPESYRENHLPGAKMIDAHEADFVKKVKAAVSKKDIPVVVYCANFSCELSTHAAKMLADSGLAKVYDFKGGIADWKEKYPLHTGCPEAH